MNYFYGSLEHRLPNAYAKVNFSSDQPVIMSEPQSKGESQVDTELSSSDNEAQPVTREYIKRKLPLRVYCTR